MSIVSDFKDINARLRGDDWYEPAELAPTPALAVAEAVDRQSLERLLSVLKGDPKASEFHRGWAAACEMIEAWVRNEFKVTDHV